MTVHLTIDKALYQEVQSLPENLQKEALNYIRYLKQTLTQNSKTTDITPISENLRPEKSKQQLAYEWMNDMASKPHSFNGLDVMAWQQQQREDNVLANRNL